MKKMVREKIKRKRGKEKEWEKGKEQKINERR